MIPLLEKRFFPGEEVITLTDRWGIKSGTVGLVDKRWVGNIYAVATKDGGLDWFFEHELQMIDPDKHRINEGDVVMVIPQEKRSSGIKGGDLVRVVKAIDQISYYNVLIDDDLHWYTWMELAPYM